MLDILEWETLDIFFRVRNVRYFRYLEMLYMSLECEMLDFLKWEILDIFRVRYF